MTENRWNQFVLWMLVSALGVLVLSIAVVHLPYFARKLFLVALFFSVLASLGMRWLMDQFKINSTHIIFGVCVLFVFLGQIVSGLESHRLWSRAIKTASKKSPVNQFFSKAPNKENLTEDQKKIHRYLKNLTQPKLQFADYLKHRYSRVGVMKSPGPEMTWGLEMIGTSLFGVTLVFSRYRRFEAPTIETENLDHDLESDEIAKGEES